MMAWGAILETQWRLGVQNLSERLGSTTPRTHRSIGERYVDVCKYLVVQKALGGRRRLDVMPSIRTYVSPFLLSSFVPPSVS